MQITIQRAEAITPALEKEINAVSRDVFTWVNHDGTDPDGNLWAQGEWYLILWVDEVWHSLATVIERTILVGEQTVRVGGVGGVMTRPESRGLSYSSAIMARAATFICEERGLDAGMLYCFDELIPFYERFGWQRITAPLTCESLNGRRQLTGHNRMVLPCGDTSWPPGPIDVRGTLW